MWPKKKMRSLKSVHFEGLNLSPYVFKARKYGIEPFEQFLLGCVVYYDIVQVTKADTP